MKVLFIKSSIHHKNLNFILNCKIIKFTIIDNVFQINQYDLNSFDAVISPCHPIDVSKYPNIKFIFGPQFSVFPDDKLSNIKGHNVVYNLLSEWVINIWKTFPVCNNLKFVALPFGVDTEKFIDIKSIQDRNEVIVYFKHRNPSDLLYIENFLKNKNINYVVFSYDRRYDENDYIHHLQNSKFCIWVDAHESQGFALQEALSCNVPLLVWNITSMNQEYGSNYQNWPATTTSYWDSRCGEKFHNINELEITFDRFIQNINNYKPREFILENLSAEVCENRFINLINNM
jgi:glycosyltransferase involved in cell wall biosynthesis